MRKYVARVLEYLITFGAGGIFILTLLKAATFGNVSVWDRMFVVVSVVYSAFLHFSEKK